MLLVFGFNLLVFIVFCLVMNCYYKNFFGYELLVFWVFLLCGVVLFDLGLVLVFLIYWQGVEIGIVFWFCLLMLVVGMLVLLFVWWLCWVLFCVVGVLLFGGVLVLLC